MSFRQRIYAGISGLVLTLLLLLFTTDSPLSAISAFFITPFSNPFYLFGLIALSLYLLLGGSAIISGFKAGGFNLGGEGQIYAGMFAGSIIAQLLPYESGYVGSLLILLSAAMSGAFIAYLSALMRKYFKVPELLSSYLLSRGIIIFLDFLLSGPLRDTASNLLAGPKISEAFLFDSLFASRMHMGLLLVPLLFILVHRLLSKSLWAQETDISGENTFLAITSGIHADRRKIEAFSLSGLLFGLIGGFILLGPMGRAMVGSSGGFGWSAITAALLAGNKTKALIPAALFLALLEQGSQSALVFSNFKFEVSFIIQGIMLILLALPFTKKILKRDGGQDAL